MTDTAESVRKMADDLDRYGDTDHEVIEALCDFADLLERFEKAPKATVYASLAGYYKVGPWLSAALEDRKVCEEMKADIRSWMAATSEALAAYDAAKANDLPSFVTAEMLLPPPPEQT